MEMKRAGGLKGHQQRGNQHQGHGELHMDFPKNHLWAPLMGDRLLIFPSWIPCLFGWFHCLWISDMLNPLQFLAVSTNYDLYVVKSTIYPWSHTSRPHLFVFCDASIFAGLSPLVWWSTPGLDGGFNHGFWMVKTHFWMANYYFLGFAEGTTENITDLPWIDSPSSGK